MAIAFDAATDGSSANSTSLIWAHTCSGSNRLLVVVCYSASGDVITGVTYNAAALTLVHKAQVGASGAYVYTFFLLGPATGANNVVVTASGSVTLAGVSASYTGVQQSAQPDSVGTQSVTGGTTCTVSTTVVSASCWLIGGFSYAAGSASAGGGTTFRISPLTQQVLADSNGIVGTGAQSLVASVGGNTNWGAAVGSFIEAAGGGGGVTLTQLKKSQRGSARGSGRGHQ